MIQTVDEIIDISPKREKFFGCSGKMLLPSPATIEAQLRTIPEQQLITTEILSKDLAAKFNVEVTCPITMRYSLQALARDSRKNVPYWRVVKKDGGLLSVFPGGAEGQAAHLREEGFTIAVKGKASKVAGFKERLVHPAR